jgi:hypothetical protein
VGDADFVVGDVHHDGGSVEASADADVVQGTADAKGDAALVDAVPPYPVMDTVAAGGAGFGSGLIRGGRRGAVEGAVGSTEVVVLDEGLEECLELGEIARGGVSGEPAFEVWWNRSTFPHVVGWFGFEFFWTTPRVSRRVSKPLRPPRPPERRVVKIMPLSVSVEAGTPRVSVAVVNVSITSVPFTRSWAVTEMA